MYIVTVTQRLRKRTDKNSTKSSRRELKYIFTNLSQKKCPIIPLFLGHTVSEIYQNIQNMMG